MANFNSNYMFPGEGLNYILNVFPRGAITTTGTLYVGLFQNPWSTAATSGIQTFNPATTVLTGSQTYATNCVVEANFTGYTRQPVTSGQWGNPTTATFTVSGTVSGQTTTATGTYQFTANSTGTVNGIFLTNTSGTGVTTSGTGLTQSTPTVLWYAPFSDLNPVTLASGDSLTVTPTWQFAPNAG